MNIIRRKKILGAMLTNDSKCFASSFHDLFGKFHFTRCGDVWCSNYFHRSYGW